MKNLFKFTNQEVADLVRAMEDAQNELCVDLSNPGRFPEATAVWGRWESLIQRFKHGAKAD